AQTPPARRSRSQPDPPRSPAPGDHAGRGPRPKPTRASSTSPETMKDHLRRDHPTEAEERSERHAGGRPTPQALVQARSAPQPAQANSGTRRLLLSQPGSGAAPGDGRPAGSVISLTWINVTWCQWTDVTQCQ